MPETAHHHGALAEIADVPASSHWLAGHDLAHLASKRIADGPLGDRSPARCRVGRAPSLVRACDADQRRRADPVRWAMSMLSFYTRQFSVVSFQLSVRGYVAGESPWGKAEIPGATAIYRPCSGRLDPTRCDQIEMAKDELRALYGRPRRRPGLAP